MKKIITIFTLFFIGYVEVNGQVLFYANFSSLSNSGSLSSVITMPGNVSNPNCCPNTISMKIASTSLPSGWALSICDPNGCHAVGVDSTTFTLGVGGSGYIGADFHTSTTIGTGYATIILYNSSGSDTFNLVAQAPSSTGITNSNNNNSLLLQNYPNPFSGSTTIRYNVAYSNTNLIITNIEGKIISQHQLISASGEIILSEKMSPGTYIYSVYAGNTMLASNTMIVR